MPGSGSLVLDTPLSVAPSVAELEAVEEDVVSVGMEVRPSSSPRSPGVVCYSLAGVPPSLALGAPDLEPPPPLDLAAVTPTAAGSKLRDGASPLVAARQSARLSQSRVLLDGRVPTIQEKAAMRAAARDLSSGTPSIPSIPSSSGSRFSVLGFAPLSHLAEVATDSGIVFRGEKGPILEQISAICAKERLDGALAEARACAARGDPSTPANTDPSHRETRNSVAPPLETVVETPSAVPSPVRELHGRPPTRLNPTEHQIEVCGSSSRSASLGPEASAAPPMRGRHGRPVKASPRPAIDGRASSAPLAGPMNSTEVIK